MVLIFGWYSWELCLSFLLSVLIHEMSHLAALKCLGISVHTMELKLSGGVIDAGPMTEWEELVCASAGPAGSGLLAVLLLRLWPVGSVVSLGLGVLNLLPLLPLDGGRVLKAILRILVPCWSETIMKWSTFVVAGTLMIGACWITIWLQAGIWPIFAALVLLWRTGETEK